MKTLSNYIYKRIIENKIELIDQNILLESLQSSILQDVAKQLKNIRTEKNIKNTEKRIKDIETTGSSYRSSWVNSPQFNSIFGIRYIAWDQITDKDFKVIDTGSRKPEDNKKEDSFIRKVIRGNTKAIILVYDVDIQKYTYVILSWGQLIQLTDDGTYYGHAGRVYSELKEHEKLDMIRGNRIFWLDLSDGKFETQQKRNERYENQKGVINFDPDSLKRIASDNRKRYKEMVAQIKANKINNDDLINRVGEIIENVSKLATDIAKDPTKNADLISKVSTLTKYIYDKQQYISQPRGAGYYSGVHGLLPMLIEYTDSLNGTKKSGESYYHRRLKTAEENLKNSVQKVEQLAKQYNIEI